MELEQLLQQTEIFSKQLAKLVDKPYGIEDLTEAYKRSLREYKKLTKQREFILQQDSDNEDNYTLWGLYYGLEFITTYLFSIFSCVKLQQHIEKKVHRNE